MKRLQDNLNSQYIAYANRLRPNGAKQRIVAYVESYDDVFFWRNVLQEFEDDIQARTAVEQGRADAYVTDYTLILNAIVKNPGAYAVAGDVFGPIDPYGIGLPKDSDGVAFVNEFLRVIEAEGTWAQLWQVSLGDRTGIDTAPEAPAIAE